MKFFLIVQLNLLLCATCVPLALTAQVMPWTALPDQELTGSSQWSSMPENYLVSGLDRGMMQSQIEKAPEAYRGIKPVEVHIPSPEGQILRFALQKSVTLPLELSKKYPDIQTYQGYGIDNAQQKIRLELTPSGLHAMMWLGGKIAMLEPFQGNQHIAYWAENYPISSGLDGMVDLSEGKGSPVERDIQQGGIPQHRDLEGDILVYRIAIAADTGYTHFFGGKQNALAEIAVILNQANEIYMREASIQFQLVANNDLIIFDGASPYSFIGVGQNDVLTASENQVVLDTAIGSANYDLGCVLRRTSGIGGQGMFSDLAAVCQSPNKGTSSVSASSPQGPLFFTSVLNLIGRLFGATSTYNQINSPCQGIRFGNTAFEPGAGSTIMGFFTGCSPAVALMRDNYFHAASLEQIHTYSRTGLGATCPTTIVSNNQKPTVSVGMSGFMIPTSTPFELIGDANDPDGDSLTYCWEQMDLGPEGHPDMPVGNAPLFRSFLPTPDSNRIFPQISDLVLNQQTTGEILPDYGRDMNFRLTIRDQEGGINEADISFEIDSTAGPFSLIYPNDPFMDHWTGGTCEQILWDVANTDNALVNCQTVNILLSTDGGYTFPYTLAEHIPNTGSAVVLIPEVNSTACRIKIQAADNVFFTLSNFDFTIQMPTEPGISLFVQNSTTAFCQGGSTSYLICTASQLGFGDSMNVFVSGLEPELSATITPSTIVPGDSILLEVSGGDTLASGTYSFNLIAQGLNTNVAEALFLNLEIIEIVEISQVAGISPLAGNSQTVQSVSFSWEAAATADVYHLELAISPSFGSSIIYSNEHIASSSFTLPIVLQSETVYYWRVRGLNTCAAGPMSDINAFQTGSCEDLTSTNVPVSIPAFGIPAVINSTANISLTGAIDHVQVFDILGLHSSIDDISMSLISPLGTEVQLFSQICTDTSMNFDLGFSDNGASTIDCPPTTGNIYQPQEALSAFAGENPLGNWTLKIQDDVAFNGGELQSWSLEVCKTVLNRPELIQNQGLQTQQWKLDTLDNSLLAASDAAGNDQQIVYTILTLPQNGGLLLNGNNLSVGDTFLQSDVDLQHIAYLHNGSATSVDSFRFDLRGVSGNWNGVYMFPIQIEPNLNTGVASDLSGLSLDTYPNPTEEALFIELKGLDHGKVIVELYTMQGQLIKQESQLLSGGNLQTSLSMGQLSPALYMLRIATSKGDIFRKILKK